MTIKELLEIATEHHIENYDIEIRNYIGRLSTKNIFINDINRTVVIQGEKR